METIVGGRSESLVHYGLEHRINRIPPAISVLFVLFDWVCVFRTPTLPIFFRLGDLLGSVGFRV